MTTQQKFFFGLVFLSLLIGRLCIAGIGYLDDTDEWLYYWIDLHAGTFNHSSTWVRAIFDMQGQPPEILIRFLQYKSVLPLAHFMHKHPLHPDILYYIGLYNIVASLFLLTVVFRILRKLDFSFEWSLTGVFLLGTLFNYNLHTRHILPYDHALIFQLLAFNFLLRKQPSDKIILIAGLLSAVGITTYYGSFMFVFINAGIIVFRNYEKMSATLRKTFVFILPFLLVYGGYELLTRIHGRSYFDFVTQYSTTVNMGSYDEGYNYIFRYFFAAEKWSGVILLLMFFGGIALLFKSKNNVLAKQVLLLGIIAYLSYGTMVYFTHKVVFHGRILHPYYLFIIAGVLFFLRWLKEKFPAIPMAKVVSVFAFVNYGFVIVDFNHIGYPREALYKFQLVDNPTSIQFHYYEEMRMIPYWQMKDWKWGVDFSKGVALSLGSYNVGNLGFVFHYPDSAIRVYPFPKFSDRDSLVFEKLHFQSHPAYAFEYCARNGRNIFISKQLKIRITKINTP